ncbi:hypothetical protein C8J57DRAFT_1727673 [Mycena rebaudengoi]|nr:hypothetical protein C8J57DRAFT_1727673 [Mycena rebaudengoi]
MAITGEVYRQAFPNSAKPMLSYGIPFGEACRKHAEEYGVKKIYILASETLSRNTDLLQDLKRALDGMVVGERIGMTPHTLVSEVVEVLHDVRRTGADCIVTLGGGPFRTLPKPSPLYAEANDVQTRENLLNLPHMMAKDRPSKPTRMPYILIPSTLSGGEYSSYSGVTDEQTNIKYQLCNLAPADVVILSGELAATTPEDVWIASGVRAIEHCCENLCTFKKEEPWAVVEKAQIDGLKLLVPNLLKTLEDPRNATARFSCQLGVGIPYKTVWLEYEETESLSKRLGAPPTSTKPDGRPFYSLPMIHDPATGAVLDKAYPDTPRLSPAGTAAFQRVFEEYAGSLLVSTLRWYALPGSYAKLNSASKGYFRRTKEEALGKTLEEVTPKGEEHVKSMEKIKDALGKIDAWIKLSGPTSSCIMGDTISFADVWTVSHLKWIQLVVPDLWEEIQLWNDGRWANLLQDFEKYGTIV